MIRTEMARMAAAVGGAIAGGAAAGGAAAGGAAAGDAGDEEPVAPAPLSVCNANESAFLMSRVVSCGRLKRVLTDLLSSDTAPLKVMHLRDEGHTPYCQTEKLGPWAGVKGTEWAALVRENPNTDAPGGLSNPGFLAAAGRFNTRLAEWKMSPTCRNCSGAWFGREMASVAVGEDPLCMRCSRARVPARWSAENDMDFGELALPSPLITQPGQKSVFEQHTYTMMERAVIAKVQLAVVVVRLPARKGHPSTRRHGQFAMRGHAIAFLQDTAVVATALPRTPNELQTVVIRRRHDDNPDGAFTDFRVSRFWVSAALGELRLRHPQYISAAPVDVERLSQLPVDGSILPLLPVVYEDDFEEAAAPAAGAAAEGAGAAAGAGTDASAAADDADRVIQELASQMNASYIGLLAEAAGPDGVNNEGPDEQQHEQQHEQPHEQQLEQQLEHEEAEGDGDDDDSDELPELLRASQAAPPSPPHAVVAPAAAGDDDEPVVLPVALNAVEHVPAHGHQLTAAQAAIQAALINVPAGPAVSSSQAAYVTIVNSFKEM
jgi:hypothetical protein